MKVVDFINFGSGLNAEPSAADENLEHGVYIGWYIIRHVETGRFYVGSASNLFTRKRTHLGKLRNRKSDCKALQEVYNSDPKVEFHFVITEDREEAYDGEQAILDKYWGNPILLNGARNARISRLGASFTDKAAATSKANMEKANKDRSKKVCISGVVYESISDAARQLSVTLPSIRHRIKAGWPNCYYV